MSVNALAVRGGRDVLEVRVDGSAEQLDLLRVGGVGVNHGIAPGNGVRRHGSAGLGAAELESAGGGRFVCGAVLAVHLLVGELDDHLNVGVGRAPELLDQALAVALVGLDGKLVLADDVSEVLDSAVNLRLNLLRDVELDGLRLGEVGANRGVGEVNLVVEDQVVDKVINPVGRGTVHHGVFTHEAGGTVVVDDELQRLVVPTVGTISVPVLVRALLESHGGRIVEADNEGRRLNRLNRGSVAGVGIEEDLAGIGPNISVLRRQRADGGDGARRQLVNPVELLLKLRSVELLSANLVSHLEDLVLSDDDDVLVLLGGELDRVVGGTSCDTAGVEHPLVAVHANGHLLHVFRLESARVDQLLELEDGAGDGSGALRRVSPVAVIAVRVEVADVGDHGVAIGKVRRLVPPVIDPVLNIGVLPPGDKLLLQLSANTTGLDEFLDCRLASLQLGGS